MLTGVGISWEPPKLGALGSAAGDAGGGGADPYKNTSLHVRYRAEFSRSRSNRIGSQKNWGTLEPRPLGMIS